MKVVVATILSLLGFVACKIPNCEQQEKCIDVLKKFTNYEEFKIYDSKEEIDAICSAATDAFICVSQTRKSCQDPADGLALSSVFHGTDILLRDLCGYRTRRRPCCHLRDVYLEHNSCYKNITKDLDDCNEQYRTSLEWTGREIKTIKQQNEERFCSMKWFGECVRRVTQKNCGKAAARVMKTYASKAGRLHRSFFQKNGKCKNALFGFQKISKNSCEEKKFKHCLSSLNFVKPEQAKTTEELMISGDYLLSLCQQLKGSVECLDNRFEKCLLNTQVPKLARSKNRNGESKSLCKVDVALLENYKADSKCLEENNVQMNDCLDVFVNPSRYTNHTLLPSYYLQYYCFLLNRMVDCISLSARVDCGVRAQETVSNILHMAADDVLDKCSHEREKKGAKQN